MATSGGGKPARKTPAKRGPTKAAALKALGLTQEDLNAIKELRELKAVLDKNDLPSPMQSVPQAVRDLVGHQDHKKQGEAASGSTENSVPEYRPVDPVQPAELPTQPEEAIWYARNLRHVEVSFRLTRQRKSDERRTELKPRGQRGDMVRLESRDLKDS